MAEVCTEISEVWKNVLNTFADFTFLREDFCDGLLLSRTAEKII